MYFCEYTIEVKLNDPEHIQTFMIMKPNDTSYEII